MRGGGAVYDGESWEVAVGGLEVGLARGGLAWGNPDWSFPCTLGLESFWSCLKEHSNILQYFKKPVKYTLKSLYERLI